MGRRRVKSRGLVECAACGSRVAKLKAYKVGNIKFERLSPYVCVTCVEMTEAQHKIGLRKTNMPAVHVEAIWSAMTKI